MKKMKRLLALVLALAMALSMAITTSFATVEVPDADSTLTITEARALGLTYESNDYTEGKYYVTGTIKNVYNTTYGNMYIVDDEGNELCIYGTYSEDGSTRYDKMDPQPVAGDIVTVYGIIGQYTNKYGVVTPQMKNGWVTEHIPAGSQGNPYVYDTLDAFAGEVTVPAGATVWYVVPAGGLAMTVVDATTAVNVMGPRGNVLAYTSDGNGTAVVDYSEYYMEGDQVLFGLYNQNPSAATTVTVSFAAPVYEVGAEKNPAVVEYNEMLKGYFMNTTLEANDEDGYWYSFVADKDGVVCIETSSADGYEVILYQGWNQMLASESNPIISYRVSKGDELKVQVTGEFSYSTWSYAAAAVNVYASIYAATEEAPVPVNNSESFRLPVTTGTSVSFVDNCQGLMAEAGLEISAYDVSTAVVTVDGVEYTDIDGDGKIELDLNGNYYNRPVITVTHNSNWDTAFTVTVVDGAAEDKPVCACGNEAVYYPAVEVGCHQNGCAEYWYCETCMVVYPDFALTAGYSYKDLIIYAEPLTYVEKVAAGCHQNGCAEYWYCEECEAVFADAAGTQLTNRKNLTIVADPLVYMPAVEACHQNGSAEYWFCAECQAVFADAAGTQLTNRMNLTVPADCELVYMPAVEACHQNGSAEYWFCPECEAVFADAEGRYLTNRMNLTVPADCELTYVEAVAATCYENGCAEYWYCEECEAVFADADGRYLTNRMNLTIPAGHDVEHVAESCYNTEFWYCDACESFWADAELVIMTNSKRVIKAVPTHNVEHVAESCYNTEFWYCDACETFWADEALTQITNSKNVIKAEPTHDLKHVEETCECNEYWYCTVCEIFWADEALTQITNSKNVIKAEPTHDMKDGVCTICGAEEPVEDETPKTGDTAPVMAVIALGLAAAAAFVVLTKKRRA